VQGNAVCSFTVVTNQFFMKNDKKVEEPEFHYVAAFGKTVVITWVLMDE
jgi:single-stranded DNA-binding protein